MINIHNLCQLQGRLVADPELRTTASGIEVASFCIAIDRGYAKEGEEKQTDFINCTAWRKTGVFVNTYFKKGKEIKVLGSLQSRKYEDKEGKQRTAYEILCEQVAFVGSKNAGENDSSAPSAGAPAASPSLDVATDDDDFPF